MGMRSSKKFRKHPKKRRSRANLFQCAEMVRMSDGSFYTRKTTMPSTTHYDESLEGQFPASLRYEISRDFVKGDVLQSFVFRSTKEDRAKVKRRVEEASRSARYRTQKVSDDVDDTSDQESVENTARDLARRAR